MVGQNGRKVNPSRVRFETGAGGCGLAHWCEPTHCFSLVGWEERNLPRHEETHPDGGI